MEIEIMPLFYIQVSERSDRAEANLNVFYGNLGAALSGRCAYLVTILVDDHFITEYLEYDGHYDRFIWGNDWYEGQENVKFVGCVPVRDLRVEGSGESVTVDVWHHEV
jgi:hypothetical protein